VRQHAATTYEIRALCQDLQVLGRSEFKALLKWRATLLKDLAKELRQATTGKEEDEAEEAAKGKGKKQKGEEEQDATDPEEAMLREMAEVKAAVEQREKREHKKMREAKRKARVRWVLFKAVLSGFEHFCRPIEKCGKWVIKAGEEPS
ncbi:hypothetical protein DUNSADRAFT_4964, partial [Dunaliella salina]